MPLAMSIPFRAAAIGAGLLALTACAPKPEAPVARAPDAGWGDYGGDPGGQRFSTAAQITPANVGELKVAWTYSTGEVARHGKALEHASFENTPILAEGRLYVCSQFNAVSALDPGTGSRSGPSIPRSTRTSAIRTRTSAAASPSGATRRRRPGPPARPASSCPPTTGG